MADGFKNARKFCHQCSHGRIAHLHKPGGDPDKVADSD